MNIETPASEARYVGQPLRRREDVRFLRGRGQFVDDVAPPGTAWCAFVRSPHGHARIRGISTKTAAAMPGVLCTLTAEDWKRAGHGELTVVHPMPFSDGRPMNNAPRPAFAGDKVRHVGDIVAAVVADSRFAAEDAAEAVAVDYEPLPSVCDPRAALAPGAPLIHERFGSNIVFDIERGNREKTEAAMAGAAKIVALQLHNSRLAANPLEPRAYLCEYDAAADRYTLYATTQQPHYLRRWLSVYTLHIPEHKIRVISPDVGGGFGVKGNFAVEVSTIAWAAQVLRRPVRWTATRTDTFLSDAQARDHHTHARMGFDRDGRIVAMQVDTLAALGGYLSNFAPSIPGNSYPQTITGLYRTPNLHLRVRGVYTNTVPVDAYRGSGRPEATWINERLIERGAHELGIDVVEMRRRNLIGRDDFPYPAPGGRIYDSGDPPALLEKLLSLANYPALRKEQTDAAAAKHPHGHRACLLHRQGRHRAERQSRQARRAARRLGERDRARAQRRQGHRARRQPFARPGPRHHLRADRRGPARARHRRHPRGRGRHRSHSVRQRHLGRALRVGRRHGDLPGVGQASSPRRADLPPRRWNAPADDIVYRRGRFGVHGTDRSDRFRRRSPTSPITAQSSADGSLEPGLEVTEFYDPPDTNDPQAMHLAVVIVDAETGAVNFARFTVRDDCGMIVNPMIVEGQVHGGMAQGVGQALMEQIVYDRDGQLLTGSFMDYAMPRAADLPSFHTGFIETPAPSNPLGVKGGSESGTIGAPAAIGNAVIDALWHLGVRDITLPITPETVWRALQTAQENPQ